MRSKELSLEVRDRIVSKHRSGGYQKMSAALKVPKNTVASILLKWKKFGTTKIEHSGEKGLGQGGDQEHDGHSDRVPLWRRKNLPEGQSSLQHSTNHVMSAPAPPLWRSRAHLSPLLRATALLASRLPASVLTNQAFVVEWPDRFHSSVKGT